MRNQQIAVEAENPDEAFQKVLKGEGTTTGGSWNIQQRLPTQPQQPIKPNG